VINAVLLMPSFKDGKPVNCHRLKFIQNFDGFSLLAA